MKRRFSNEEIHFIRPLKTDLSIIKTNSQRLNQNRDFHLFLIVKEIGITSDNGETI